MVCFLAHLAIRLFHSCPLKNPANSYGKQSHFRGERGLRRARKFAEEAKNCKSPRFFFYYCAFCPREKRGKFEEGIELSCEEGSGHVSKRFFSPQIRNEREDEKLLASLRPLEIEMTKVAIMSKQRGVSSYEYLSLSLIIVSLEAKQERGSRPFIGKLCEVLPWTIR